MAAAEEQALNEVMQMLKSPPDTSKPSDFPVSLSANNVSKQREKLIMLVSTGKCKEALGTQLPHDQMKPLSETKMWRNFTDDVKPTIRQTRV